jgi:predicted dehydrogenase
MRQVIQSYRTGEVAVREVPAPHCPTNGLLVRNHASLVSIGTERGIIELGRKNLLGKARARPDLARRALQKARQEGFWKVFQESQARIDSPTPLGYSSAGVVLEVGEHVHEYAKGDRVACVGIGFASHAEIVAVPVNLASKIPEGLDYDDAAFAMVGAIALHGVRESQLTFGSHVAVLGLGLLGLLSVQMLCAYGCRVVAMDPDPAKAVLATRFGALRAATSNEELLEIAAAQTGGFGMDAVIVTAATKSAEPVNTALALSRQKGRIVMVGTGAINPDRNEMWQKEVEIVVSKAGGPGALDPLYELDGVDIPIAYARWTQERNVAEFLRLAAAQRIDLKSIITHRVPVAEAAPLYASLVEGQLGNAIGIVLEYPNEPLPARRVVLREAKPMAGADCVRAAVLGAGQFGATVMLPLIKSAAGVDCRLLATTSGATAEHNARKFGFAECTTDVDAAFQREDIDAIFALTPHSAHAHAAVLAAHNGKALFVEKPLCVTREELDEIEKAYIAAARVPLLMVGHNRRYSPHAIQIGKWLEGRSAPLVFNMRINAGFVPGEHWVHSDAEGRSRILGEMTHFLDFGDAIVGAPLCEVHAMRIAGDDRTVLNNDNLVVNLRFADGSVGSLFYSAQGPRRYPREQFEIYSGGKTIVSRDFVKSELYSASTVKTFKTAQAYGYKEEIAHFIAAVRAGDNDSLALENTFRTARAAFAVERALATGQPQAVA